MTAAKEVLEQQKKETLQLRVMLRESEAGKLLMATLEEMYYAGDLAGKDIHDTYRNLGRRDVVLWLRGVRDTQE
jgi:acyl-coenzyme A synthetase/AMP-(fatty) acid ligase